MHPKLPWLGSNPSWPFPSVQRNWTPSLQRWQQWLQDHHTADDTPGWRYLKPPSQANQLVSRFSQLLWTIKDLNLTPSFLLCEEIYESTTTFLGLKKWWSKGRKQTSQTCGGWWLLHSSPSEKRYESLGIIFPNRMMTLWNNRLIIREDARLQTVPKNTEPILEIWHSFCKNIQGK